MPTRADQEEHGDERRTSTDAVLQQSLVRRKPAGQTPDDPDALADAGGDGDYIGVSELASAAGSGAVVDDERVTGRVMLLTNQTRASARALTKWSFACS